MCKHRKNTMFPASRTTTKTSCFAGFAGAVKTLAFYSFRGVWGLKGNAFYVVFGAPGDENNVKCEDFGGQDAAEAVNYNVFERLSKHRKTRVFGVCRGGGEGAETSYFPGVWGPKAENTVTLLNLKICVSKKKDLGQQI